MEKRYNNDLENFEVIYVLDEKFSIYFLELVLLVMLKITENEQISKKKLWLSGSKKTNKD